jgi:hypothetical protein
MSNPETSNPVQDLEDMTKKLGRPETSDLVQDIENMTKNLGKPTDGANVRDTRIVDTTTIRGDGGAVRVTCDTVSIGGQGYTIVSGTALPNTGVVEAGAISILSRPGGLANINLTERGLYGPGTATGSVGLHGIRDQIIIVGGVTAGSGEDANAIVLPGSVGCSPRRVQPQNER